MTDAIYRPQRNWGARIHDYTSHGMRLVILENELLRIGVLAGKGADIVELNYKPRDLDLVWLAPGGVRNPLTHTTTAPDSKAAYVETYPGGWQELFPNGGVPCTVNGGPLGQHGEVYSLPWDVEIVEDSAAACAVRFTIRTRTSPCVIEKTIRVESGRPGFRIEERLRNESSVPVPAVWGHHITFGHPFLGPGSQVELPDGITAHTYAAPANGKRRVSGPGAFAWPVDPATGVDLRTLPERGSPSEMVFLTGFAPEHAWYTVTPAAGGPVCRVAWDGETMPVLWYWQEFGNSRDYPWFGRVYTVGLEPSTSMSMQGLAGAVENGTAMTVGAGETRTFWLELRVGDAATAP